MSQIHIACEDNSADLINLETCCEPIKGQGNGQTCKPNQEVMQEYHETDHLSLETF